MSREIDEKTQAERQAFYDRLAPGNIAPLWEVLQGLMPREPQSKATPFRWHYDDVRPLLMESGELLTAEEAERRVLVLENPSWPGQSRITASLYAGIQLILPGETAPAHRHTPSALRFVLEGKQGFTAVGGERTVMEAGDFIITPAWAWHDHGNEGDGPVTWLDVLDLPMFGYFETTFFQGHNDLRHMTSRPEGDSLARFGEGLLPIDPVQRYGQTSPIFNYPYARTREALLAAAQGQDPDPHLATTLRYANPTDGGWPMPTIATWMTYLPAGAETAPIRSTDGVIVSVAEGSGNMKIGEEIFDFREKDTITAPGWAWRSFRAETDCFMFHASDRVVHEKLGMYREERAGA
jgi:gentisate 1,2-dioxygenase